eukprot:9276651-Alexandrium_andersonii.AAC.1
MAHLPGTSDPEDPHERVRGCVCVCVCVPRACARALRYSDHVRVRAFSQVPRKTLARWRCTGGGPSSRRWRSAASRAWSGAVRAMACKSTCTLRTKWAGVFCYWCFGIGNAAAGVQ